MKRIFLLLILIPIAAANAQWQNVGNADRIKAYEKNISDLVISEDNKFIYTLGDTNVIKKWDLQTGALLRTDTVKPILNFTKPYIMVFLSSDSKTYCVAYKKFTSWDSYKNIIYIYQIDDNTLSDSVDIGKMADGWRMQYLYYYKIDYFHIKKIVLCSFDFVEEIQFGFTQTGNTGIFEKNDDLWELIFSREGTPGLEFINKDFNYLFLSSYVNTSQDWPHGYGFSSDFLKASYMYCRPENNIVTTNYYTSSSYGYGSPKKTKGKYFSLNSGVFTNNYLLVIEGNKLYKRLLSHPNFQWTDIIKGVSSEQKCKMANTKNEDFFFILFNNEISQYKIDNLNKYNSFTLDSCDSITSLKSSNGDNFYYASDSQGYIYRINDSSVFNYSIEIQNSALGSLDLYPNPAFTNTSVVFTLTKPAEVSCNVYNSQGALLFSIPKKPFEPMNFNSIELNMSPYSSGLYFVVIEAGGITVTKQLVYLR